MKISNLLFGVLITFPIMVNGQELSFNDALNELVKDCPEITILKMTNNATIENEKALNRLNQPVVEVEQVWGRNGVGNKFDIGISQSFDWPGLYRARARAINAQSSASLLMEQSTMLDKVIEVKSLMIDIIYQKKNISLSTMIHNHMIELERASKESYENGEISKLEFKRAELEKIQTAIQLRENERVLNELFSALETATGKKDCVSIMNRVKDTPEWIVEPEENYESQFKELDPRMAYLKATQEAILEMSKTEKMSATHPSFNVGYVFQREQGETFNGFNFSMSLPIYGSRHVTNATKSNILAAQLEIQLEEISILSKMRSQRNAALSLARELNDYSTIFDKGNYSELLKLALEGGQTDNIHYLQELNYYMEVTKQYLELQHQYNLAVSNLNRYTMFQL